MAALAVLGFLLCAFTSVAFGIAVVRGLNVSVSKTEAVLLGYVLGNAVLSSLIRAVGLLSAANETVFVGVALAAFVVLLKRRNWFNSLSLGFSSPLTDATGNCGTLRDVRTVLVLIKAD